MNGYVGRSGGLRATLYVQLIPKAWVTLLKNPYFSSESNTLGLTAPITAECVAASRFQQEWTPREGFV